ncbi:FHA domain-containing protein [Planctomycetes bacterium Pan216]
MQARGRKVTALDEIGWPERIHWWIDAVGGFLTFTKTELRVGNLGCSDNDIAIMGGLAEHHADIKRDESGVVLTAHAPTSVNGEKGESFLLHDGDEITMEGVRLKYRQPMPWSTTARLEIESHHRLPLGLDAVLLLGDLCLLADHPDAHIRTHWPASVFIRREHDRYWVQSETPLVIDGVSHDRAGPLTPRSHVEADWGSFSFESVDETGR